MQDSSRRCGIIIFHIPISRYRASILSIYEIISGEFDIPVNPLSSYFFVDFCEKYRHLSAILLSGCLMSIPFQFYPGVCGNCVSSMVPSMQGSIGVFRPPTPATPLPAEFFAEDDKRESEALEKFKQQPEAHLMSNDETTTTKPPTVSAKDLEAMTQEERDTHSMPPPPPPNAASGWQEMIAAAPALAESCAVVYVNAPVDELITRVLFVLRRDQIRQKDLATSINISGSTLSPMLRGKYRHTKDSHIAKLREWLYQRDKLFCATSLHQAVLKGLNEETLAAALGVERSLLARWLHFGLPFPERTTVDEHFLTWSGANTAAPSEETENITTSHRPSPAQSPRPFSRASNGSSLGNASSLSNSSSLSNGLSLGSATPPGTVSPLSTLDIRVQTAGLWRLPSTSTASNSNSGSLAGHTLSGVSSPYPASEPL